MGVRAMSDPVIKEVLVSKELKRAQDAFYDAMFRGDEEEMLAANSAVGIMNQWMGYRAPSTQVFKEK